MGAVQPSASLLSRHKNVLEQEVTRLEKEIMCQHQWVIQSLYWPSYSVSVPDFDDLGVSRNNKIQLIVEVQALDGQVVEVVFHQQWLAGAQVIEQHLRDQTKGLKRQ